jgi:DNA-directed RNA polymerase specialized sigma24 family protein
MSETDEELARRAGRGDRPALQRLLARHHDTAFRFSYRVLGSRSDAQDVAQEVCIRLVERVASFRGDSRFSTWLYQLALNACRDHRRRQGRGRPRWERRVRRGAPLGPCAITPGLAWSPTFQQSIRWPWCCRWRCQQCW